MNIRSVRERVAHIKSQLNEQTQLKDYPEWEQAKKAVLPLVTSLKEMSDRLVSETQKAVSKFSDLSAAIEEQYWVEEKRSEKEGRDFDPVLDALSDAMKELEAALDDLRPLRGDLDDILDGFVDTIRLFEKRMK